MATHLISFGHNPNADKGAIYKNRNEATEVRRLKPYLEKWAKKSKHNFKYYTRDMFADRNIHQHKHFNSITELHMDAPQGNGGHVIIHKDFKPDNIDKRLRDVIKKHFGIVGYLQNSNGFSYRNNLYNINQAAKHGINYRLVEMFFLSNEQDYNHYIRNLDSIAKDIIEAITGEELGGNTNVSKPVKPSTNEPKPTPSKPKPANKANLKVDGYLGPDTVKALQRYFGLIVDGEIWGQYSGNQATKAFNQKAVKYGKGGSPVVKALQKKIGATADGIWGANTTRALQRYLGTPVDGIISRPSTVIKELQKRLNNGTF